MWNAEYRNAMLGFAPIQHSEFQIPHSYLNLLKSKRSVRKWVEPTILFLESA